MSQCMYSSCQLRPVLCITQSTMPSQPTACIPRTYNYLTYKFFMLQCKITMPYIPRIVRCCVCSGWPLGGKRSVWVLCGQSTLCIPKLENWVAISSTVSRMGIGIAHDNVNAHVSQRYQLSCSTPYSHMNKRCMYVRTHACLPYVWCIRYYHSICTSCNTAHHLYSAHILALRQILILLTLLADVCLSVQSTIHCLAINMLINFMLMSCMQLSQSIYTYICT